MADPQPPGQDPFEGLMRISQRLNMETVKVSHFIIEDGGMVMNDLQVDVQYRTAPFAVAAMLRGLEEFYFKPAGGEGLDEATSTHFRTRLEQWFKMNKYEAPKEQAKSSLILP